MNTIIFPSSADQTLDCRDELFSTPAQYLVSCLYEVTMMFSVSMSHTNTVCPCSWMLILFCCLMISSSCSLCCLCSCFAIRKCSSSACLGLLPAEKDGP